MSKYNIPFGAALPKSAKKKVREFSLDAGKLILINRFGYQARVIKVSENSKLVVSKEKTTGKVYPSVAIILFQKKGEKTADQLCSWLNICDHWIEVIKEGVGA